MLLPHDGQLKQWEDFASGRSIYERFGKKAADITDDKDWQGIAHDLVLGIFNHVALLQPDIIVIGGSIGTYFDNYSKYLIDELKALENVVVPIPTIVKAQRPEEVVLFGCYDAAKQQFGESDASAA